MPDQRIITSLSGTPATLLGLGAHPKQVPQIVSQAHEAGINYFFCYNLGPQSFVEELKSVAHADRENILIATGSGARQRTSLLAARRKVMAALAIDLIDLFFTEYVHPGDDPAAIFGAGGVLDELQRWKSDGVIRFVGASAHDRQLAALLATDPRVDVLMHRFNMAHRKAATEVFPKVLESQTPLVAFTATRWGTLLTPPEDWPGDAPIAADCYRYCLTHSAVSLVLTAPTSMAELNANLQVLDAPPLDANECHHWEQFGNLVYGQGLDDFETQWP